MNGSLMWVNGDGTYAAPVAYSVPNNVSSSTLIFDFNNDGYADIFAWNASANAFYEYLNKKNGTFHLQASNILSSGVQSMVAGDFNHDGYIDLAFLTSGAAGKQLHVFFNNHASGFTVGPVTTAPLIGQLTVGDFDGVGELFAHATMGVVGMGDVVCEGAEGVAQQYRQAVRVYPEGGARTHHLSTNLIIDVDEEAGTATCPLRPTALMRLPSTTTTASGATRQPAPTNTGGRTADGGIVSRPGPSTSGVKPSGMTPSKTCRCALRYASGLPRSIQ